MQFAETIEVAETTYVCTKCQAEDKDRGTNPPAPVALNCYQCGAGAGLAIPQMISQGAGMFPLEPRNTVN